MEPDPFFLHVFDLQHGCNNVLGILPPTGSSGFAMETATSTARLTLAQRLNFLITNRIPRRFSTLAMGRFSRIRSPLLTRLSIAVWRLFADDLRLFEARQQRFASLHECFIRQLKPGVRPVDINPQVLTSPCDAVVGEFGAVADYDVFQAKGFPYSIAELLADQRMADRYRDGRFVTLRLKSSMYHRFHAPCDGSFSEVNYISGDTWNVNPIALQIVERLFCKNERAVIQLRPVQGTESVAIVAVAAILVASMRIHGLSEPLDLRYRGPNRIPCFRSVAKGEELGYFEHGSTLVVLTTSGYEFADTVKTGEVIRMGQPLMREQTIAPA